jgi:V8-like Glu-specific endopeptidase
MRTLIYLLTFLVVTTTIINLAVSKSSPRLAKAHKLGSIVRLTHDGHTFCSGTVVNQNTIITARHCVLEETPFGEFINKEPIDIRSESDQFLGVMATAYVAIAQLDQALLVGDFSRFESRKFVSSVQGLNEFAHYDQTLVACGYPLGGNLYCNKLFYQERNLFMWSAHGLLLPGMSGGPVMLEDGTLLAINIGVERNNAIVAPIYNLDLRFKPEEK